MNHESFTSAPPDRDKESSPDPLKLADVLQPVDERPTMVEYQRAARELTRLAGELNPVRVALLATFTIDPLVPFLRVEAARHGFGADVYVGPFNAINQELLDPGSGCLRHRPDVVFLTQRLGDVCPVLADDFLALGGSDVEALIEETASSCVETVKAFRERSSAAVVVSNFSLPPEPLLGIYEEMAESSQTAAIRRLNERLIAGVKSVQGVYIQDLDRLSAQTGYRRWSDARMWHLARAPLSAHALPALAASQAFFIRALLGSPRKCLVLDLDNTLWGGVVGEQGLAGIKLGQTYPGNAFRQFQQYVLSLFRRGILLAINSKNNPDDVQEVFRSHPDMVLKPEHFAATQVNWHDKAENMVAIARELNIGLDSLVFFDDSPAECALIRRALPEVLTIEAPKDVLEYPDAIIRSGAFERLTLTAEDRARGEMYQRQADRERLSRSASSLDDFLGSLQMRAEIRPVDQFAFPRAVELTQKTNQFNLTTRRYTAVEMAAVLENPDCGAFTLRLVDRFGDNGIVGLAIVNGRDNVARVDTFLLSCRVIGRSAETALLSFVVDWARTRGLDAIEGQFVPTPKNAPAADFYARHGFTESDAVDGASTWRLDTREDGVAWPRCIQAIAVPA